MDKPPMDDISFHTILGRTRDATMKLRSNLNSREVPLIVDSGSTHNFIAKSLVIKFKLKIQQVAPFGDSFW